MSPSLSASVRSAPFSSSSRAASTCAQFCKRKLLRVGLREVGVELRSSHSGFLAVGASCDDVLDLVVHLVPVVTLHERILDAAMSDVEKSQVFLLDEPVSLLRRYDDPLTVLAVFADQQTWRVPSRFVE